MSKKLPTQSHEDPLIKSWNIRDKHTSTGRHSGYQVDLYHSGLDEHKHLSAVEHDALRGKIHNQTMTWQTKWAKELQKQAQQSKEETAKERTLKAQEKLREIEKILAHTLKVDDAIDWESLKHKDAFSWPPESYNRIDYIEFNKNYGYPEKVQLKEFQVMPLEKNYFKKIGFFQILLGQFDKAVAKRNLENDEIFKENRERTTELKAKRKQWEKEKAEFKTTQNEHNIKVNLLKKQYQEKSPVAIVEYCEMVLNNSEYLDSFPKEFDLQYNETNGMLLVDYQLPSLENIPSVNNVRYVKSRDEIEVKYLSQVARAKLYDSAIYQITLRTLHELFEADKINVLTSINLNGIVTATNPATGHKESSCIISIQATKKEFEKINLQGIVSSQGYKACFKSLKGVGSSKLSTMTAVKPLLELNRTDKRFREHYEVADDLNDGVNVAAMDWEDFEHLVRELFEKEFAGNGGEVRVTQASADGGVDAIAFDPDPIRGGKIVIQAKRYTNVVGVAAVRDLYGTVMNEGAIKGILITTADYGSGSYNFAKDKPLNIAKRSKSFAFA